MISFIFLVITLAYAILIIGFAVGFDKIKALKLKNLSPKTKFSIIVPFRNEEKHLPFLIDSILKLNYPRDLFEVVFIDDKSTDNSHNLVDTAIDKTIDHSVYDNVHISNSPKKDAITLAINNAKYEWIITTDADCSLPKNWLGAFNAYIQEQEVSCIVAPVAINNSNTFFSGYQQLDMLSLQGATIGGFGMGKPFLCNGANFAYTKLLFKSVNGFEGNTNIASGDDIFLLEKAINQNKDTVKYLKSNDCIVLTEAQPNWNQLIQQRQRWASKTSSYTNRFGKCVGVIVLLMNATIVIGTLLWVLSVLSLKTLTLIWFAKVFVDLFLIYKSAKFLNQKKALRYFTISVFIYPFINTYIAIKSQFGSYAWKERVYSK